MLEPTPAGDGVTLTGVSCYSNGCIAIGADTVYGWDGTLWASKPAPSGTLNGVACSAANVCIAVGSSNGKSPGLVRGTAQCGKPRPRSTPSPVPTPSAPSGAPPERQPVRRWATTATAAPPTRSPNTGTARRGRINPTAERHPANCPPCRARDVARHSDRARRSGRTITH